MSQMPEKPANPEGDRKTPSSFEEQTIFDGSPSWLGRAKAHILTMFFALLLVGIAIAIQATAREYPFWITIIAVVLAILLVVAQIAYHRSIRYRVTNYRIDFERGLLTHRIDSMELWHAEDLNFRQGIFQRMLGQGSIEVIANDASNPRLTLNSIPGARQVFDQLKAAILQAKRQRGLLQLDQ